MPAYAWSIPKAKSRRPCARKTGVVHRPELRQATIAPQPRTDGCDVAREGGVRVASSEGSRRSAGIEPEKPNDDAGLREALRHQRGVEVGPGLDADDGSPRHSRRERVEHGAAAVGDAPGADLRVGDVGPGREPVEDGPRVGDLAWTVDPDEPAGLAVTTRVERQDRVVVAAKAVSLDERVHLLAVAAEPVQEDDRGPAAGRGRAVRGRKRRCDRHAVAPSGSRGPASRRESLRPRRPRGPALRRAPRSRPSPPAEGYAQDMAARDTLVSDHRVRHRGLVRLRSAASARCGHVLSGQTVVMSVGDADMPDAYTPARGFAPDRRVRLRCRRPHRPARVPGDDARTRTSSTSATGRACRTARGRSRRSAASPARSPATSRRRASSSSSPPATRPPRRRCPTCSARCRSRCSA